MRIFFFVLLLSLHSYPAVKSWSSTLPDKSKFHVNTDLRKRVDFWIKIYSHYSTKQGVFHLVNDPSTVLGEIDLTEIVDDKQLTANQKRNLITSEVQRKKNILLAKYKIKDPRQVRLQMGLRDRMKKAIYLSGKYIDQMENIFKREGLPVELTRIVYVESSFNIYAHSKVGASGLWQIMPNVARAKGYIGKNFDKRNHPIEATKLAAEMLKQNYKQLKSWPLAITAYNHGLGGVRQMLRKNQAISIEELIDSDNVTPSWGFASKNFYACFLAVLEVERNAEDLLGDDLIKADAISYKEFKLKNNKRKKDVLKWFDGSITRLKQMNPHLNWASINHKKVIPAGVSLMVPRKNVYLVRREQAIY
ncbi:MAG: lytic transglycosylase domain-containing protein [Pseudobdellovibrio sp.]